MLQFHFNWKTLSAIAGVTWWNFYFRLFPGAIRSPQVVIFLMHLLQHVHGNVLVIWDGLRQHRSRLVRDFVAAQHGLLDRPLHQPQQRRNLSLLLDGRQRKRKFAQFRL